MEEITSAATNNLQKELAYYKKQLAEVSGDNIRSDYVLTTVKHELRQKKQAFAILTQLQREFTVTTPLDVIFSKTVKEINNHLSMDRSVILIPSATPGKYQAGYWSGFPDDQIPALELREVELPASIFETGTFLLHNRSSHPGAVAKQLLEAFSVNFFVSVPIISEGQFIGFMICGRMYEKVPYNSALDEGDADTMMAIAALIVSVIQNRKMMELKVQMLEQTAEKNEIVNIFGQQVSKEVAYALMNSEEGKGARKKVAVMFLDIRNFTPFVQDKSPEETVNYLNSLFGFMTAIIDQHKGIVNQFMGDGFMTTFGAPMEVENPFQNAVSAALQISKVLREKIAAGEIPLTKIGIGIHGGEAITGNVGSDTRKQYTVTGNVVIIAARLEQFTKQCDAQILISGDIQKHLAGNDCTGKSIGEVVLKGMTEPLEIYQLV